MKFPSRGLVLLAACTLTAWPACSTDMTGLESTETGGSGGGTFASGGRQGNGSGGHNITGTGSAPASGGAYASGGDSGTGGDTTGGGGSDTGTGGNTDTGGAIGTGGEATGGRAGSGGAASGGSVGTGGAASGGHGTGGGATGGAGTGGAATGGTGTGGAGTGGRAGTGGMPGSGGAIGTGGAVVGKPECVTAADCRLQNDCCACRAVPASAPPSACLLLCPQTKCAQQELPPGKMDCVAGRCVAGFACDTSTVVCDQATPACPVGSVPTVSPNGNCFSGNCAPATQCLSVDSCASCGDGNHACVTQRPKDGNTSRHCVTIPAVCEGTATCGCFGPSTCVSPTTTCTNLSGANGVSCSHS
ncbi:MAG: hypothetical protein ABJA82_16690 [Myxococcales bacterium]